MPFTSGDAKSILNEILKYIKKLPTSSGGGAGDASAANQLIGNNSLASIDTKLPSTGQKTMNNSLPVVIASDQSAIPINLGTTALISTVNSSTSLLNSGSVFTGTSEDISQYAEVRVFVFSDVASAIDGLSMQQSSNGTNWDNADVYTIPANTGKVFGIGIGTQFFRVVYTNGATNQTSFRLQVTYHKTRTKPSSQRPQDGRSNDNDMEEVLSYQMSYDPILNVWNRVQLQDLYITGQSTQTAVVNNILSTTAGTTATDVISYRAFAIQVVSTGTAGTFIFEGSNDNTNFQSIPVFNQALLIPIPIVTAITATASQIIYVGATMFRYVRLRIVTTITGGSLQAISTFTQTPFSISQTIVAQGMAANLNATVTGTVAVSSITTAVVPGTAATNLGKSRNLATGATDTGVGILALRNDTLTTFGTSGSYNTPIADKYGSLIIKDEQRHKRTYSTAFTITPATSTPTDIVQIIGSATTSVSIQRIRISGLLGTAGQVLTLLQKRSSVNTGGTSTTSTMVQHDAADVVATSVCSLYTVNPTSLGTSVGNIRMEYIPMGPVTGVVNSVEFNFAERGKPIILTGVTQALAINLNSITIAPTSVAVEIEFTEE